MISMTSKLLQHKNKIITFLLRQVERLGDNERLCLELRYFGDLSFSQIAENMGIKENNAKVLHHRAIIKLREFIPNYE